MPKYQITGPDGKAFEVTAPDGASEADVLAYAQKNFKMAGPAPAAPRAKPFGEQLNDTIADVPRALGRTARAGLQAVGGVADLVSSPIRGVLNLAGMNIKPGSGALLADKLGLPKPRPGMEQVVDSATETVAGGGLMLGGANLAAKVGAGATKAIGTMMAANPAQQLASAGASGAAGEYTRQTGGNDGAQFAASMGAGIAAPMAMGAVSRAAASMRPRPAPSPVQVDITINSAMQPNGMNLSQLSPDVANGIRSDVAKAMQIGDQLSPDAVRRLADYHLTGATPTHGSLVRTPAAFTQQKNLAKLGVNSKDPAAQALANVEHDNNSKLINVLNRTGANTADDALAGGQKIIAGVDGYNDRVTSVIGKLYAKARATDGRSAALDPNAFATKADELLTHNLRNAELPADIRNKLNSFASGETPLTVETAEQFKTIMAKVQRTSSDGGVRDAISHVRSALEETPLLPGQEMGAGAQMAFNRARNMHRQYMGVVEKTPALQAVRDGIEPDAFVQKFIVGSSGKANTMDVAMLKNSVKSNPEALNAVKEQIALHLKEKALTGKSDEVGRVSESALNKAIKAIGERKLAMFFNADELNQIRAAGRVASYEQVQPVGSAVNNSNTASTAMAGLLDRFGDSALLSKIPGGRLLAEPMQNISVGMRAGRTLDAPRALTLSPLQPQRAPHGLLMSPAALMGTEDEETRRKREAGLLAP